MSDATAERLIYGPKASRILDACKGFGFLNTRKVGESMIELLDRSASPITNIEFSADVLSAVVFEMTTK